MANETSKQPLNVAIAQQVAVSDFLNLTFVTDDLSVISREALVSVADVLHVQHAAIIELCNARGVMVHASIGWPERGEKAVAIEPSGYWLTADGLEFIQPVTVQSFGNAAAPERLAQQSIVRSLNAVIGGRSGPFGLLSVYSLSPRTFDEQEMLFVQAMAALLASTVDGLSERAKLGTYSCELSAANQQLRHFALNAASELEKPLLALVSYLDLLNEHPQPRSPSSTREYLSQARASGNRMQILLRALMQNCDIA